MSASHVLDIPGQELTKTMGIPLGMQSAIGYNSEHNGNVNKKPSHDILFLWKHLASSATLQTPTPASAVPAAVSLFRVSLPLAFTIIIATTFPPVPSPFQIIDLTFYRTADVVHLRWRNLLRRQISHRCRIRQIRYVRLPTETSNGKRIIKSAGSFRRKWIHQASVDTSSEDGSLSSYLLNNYT